MINEKSQKLIKEFVENVSVEGVLVTDDSGQRLYSTTSTLDDSDMDELATLATVSDSLFERINHKLKIDGNEMTVIINKSDYIVIKHISDSLVLLSQIKRTVDIDLIYLEVNKLAEELMNV